MTTELLRLYLHSLFSVHYSEGAASCKDIDPYNTALFNLLTHNDVGRKQPVSNGCFVRLNAQVIAFPRVVNMLLMLF